MNKLLTATLLATLIGSTAAWAEAPKPTLKLGAPSAPAAKKAAPQSEAEAITAAAAGQVAQLDTNKDGKLSKPEFLAPGEVMFAKIDTDKNGSVTALEIAAVFRERQAAQQKAMAAQVEMREKMMKMIKDAEARVGRHDGAVTTAKPAAATKP